MISAVMSEVDMLEAVCRNSHSRNCNVRSFRSGTYSRLSHHEFHWPTAPKTAIVARIGSDRGNTIRMYMVR